MKKIFVFVLTIFFLNITLITSFACTSVYNDVENSNFACSYVNQLHEYRIINGYSNKTYRPNNFATREEIAKIIVNAFGINADISNSTTYSKFKDVPSDSKFLEPIYILKKANILNGRPDNTFAPKEYITRAELSKLIVNAAQNKKSYLFSTFEEFSFTDIPSSHSLHTYVRRAYSATNDQSQDQQIISLNNELKFRPNDYVTRGELAKMISNSIKYGNFSANENQFKQISGNDSDYFIPDGDYKVYHFNEEAITIIETEKIPDYNYIPNNSPYLKTIAENIGYKYVMNGGYYGGTNVNADHAGFLNYYGINITPLKNPHEDSQIQYIVRVNKSNNTINFIHYNDFNSIQQNKNVLEFQTGPLIIENSQVRTDQIQASKDGNSGHLRSGIGISGNFKYFFIARKDYNLYDLSNTLLDMSIFKRQPLSIIMLDGGHSTSLYSKDHSELNFRETNRVPNLIGLR